jgi:hypothetical protein
MAQLERIKTDSEWALQLVFSFVSFPCHRREAPLQTMMVFAALAVMSGGIGTRWQSAPPAL